MNKNNVYYETSTDFKANSANGPDGYDLLCNRIMEVAIQDLVKSMLKDSKETPRNYIFLSTPRMGQCNDIPKHAKGKVFRFSESYKNKILNLYDSYKEANYEA